MSINTFLSKKIQKLIYDKRVFVYYRKAGESIGKRFIQEDKNTYSTKNFSESGFVMAGFDLDRVKTILIPLEKSKISNFEYLKSNVQRTTSLKNKYSDSNRAQHIRLVNKAIASIKEGNAKKIVLSQAQEYPIDTDNIGAIYIKLLQTYPNAMVYIWHHPKIGLWLGATPEKLVQITDKKYKTMALAGTQNYKENCTWEIKEIEEQKFVTDYLYKQLKPVSESVNIGKAHTVKAGHLAHIRIDINGVLLDHISVEKLMNQLHPTPAVCGTPSGVAKEFILKHENYNRDFYTGFIGELNMESTSDLSVNLRCLQVVKNKAILYVGGGITKDSSAEKEWKEILNKATVMRSVL